MLRKSDFSSFIHAELAELEAEQAEIKTEAKKLVAIAQLFTILN